MRPDVTLQHASTGRVIVLDTKFTQHSLTRGRWNTVRFNRDHLFQIYAYLRSQEGTSQERRSATGILLYPAVQHELSETIEIQGHEIRWQTIDLGQPWQDIERDLLSIPGNVIDRAGRGGTGGV
jgi:5-methylcytosine-specific restriction enzyme subunit McrC